VTDALPVPRAALFLDRDGVICRNRDDYVRSPRQLELLPGALDALRRLAPSRFAIVVVTNQSAVNRGLLAPEALEAIHARLRASVRAAGGRLDAVYHCPHRPDERCSCRKPAPGLLQRAAADLQLDLARSWLVGDHPSDLLAARAAGCRPILVASGRTPAAECAGVAARLGCPHFAALADAAEWLLRASAVPSGEGAAR